jgi:6-phosphogluconolactonase
MSTHPTVEILPDESHLAEAAADRFVGIVEATLRYRQVADVALAGGSTPRAMNALLAAPPRRSHVPWQRVRFFFGDERTVAPDDAESNYRMTRETLFAPLGIPPEHVFRMRGEDEPHAAAAAYAEVLVRELGARPRFDLLFLGMGPDGHTASIFPGTLAAIDDSKLVVANWVEQFKTWRITLTPHVINDATHVVITTGGSAKADALHGVLDGPHDPNRYPVQLVAPTDGELHWFIDEAAAAKLARRVVAATRSSSASSG